jgi:protein translocase subunit secF
MSVRQLPILEYTEYTNRQLVAVPLAVLVVAIAVLGGMWAVTGSPVTLGLEFTGGTEIQLAAMDDGPVAESTIRGAFAATPASIRTIPGDGSTVVTFGQGVEATELETQAQAAGLTVSSVSSVSASFGGETQRLAIMGVAIAFAGMSLIVFALFRVFVPAVSIVISAFSDIMIPLAVMSLLQIELTLGTVAALLMLIGYSVDSDILLTTNVLRRTGDFYESTYRARTTGITMTVTSIVAMFVMAVVAFLFGIDLLTAIGLVLVIGLSADLMNTYLLNVALLRWYKFTGVAR